MNEHVGEDAELYPLGLLDAETARAVERHVETCAECAQRVAEASSVAASLAAALPLAPPVRQPRQTRPVFGAIAAAAAIAVLLGGLAWQTIAFRSNVHRQDVVVASLVHGHFNHAAMRAPGGGAFPGKVLYARDGSWVYVVVDGPGTSLHAAALTSSGTRQLGSLQSDGTTATLFALPATRVRSISLTRDGVTVATAALVY